MLGIETTVVYYTCKQWSKVRGTSTASKTFVHCLRLINHGNGNGGQNAKRACKVS